MANGALPLDCGGTPALLTLLGGCGGTAAGLSPELPTTLNQQIFSRLALPRRPSPGDAVEACATRTPPTDEEISAFCQLAVERDVLRALGFVASLVSRGVSVESVVPLLLAPAARLLGDEWLAETCTFAEVTAGLELIAQVASVLSKSPAPDERGA